MKKLSPLQKLCIISFCFFSTSSSYANNIISDNDLRQLFIISDSSALTKEHQYGGVILFSAYFKTMGSACSLKKQYPNVSIFTDQEGGNIVRLDNNPPPSAEKARTMRKEAFINQVKLSAQTLKKSCVDVNLAPVVEMSKNDSRSYGEDEHSVIQLASLFAKTMNNEGIATINKHFPSGGTNCHTLTSLSHLGLSLKKNSEAYTCDVTDKKEFENNSSIFIKVPSDGIMVSQGIYKNFSDWPSLLEPKVGIWLKNKLQYKGVVISDSLWEIEASPFTILKALQTVDWVMVGYSKSIEDALPYLQQAIKNGELTPQQIYLKLNQIKLFKEKYYSK